MFMSTVAKSDVTLTESGLKQLRNYAVDLSLQS